MEIVEKIKLIERYVKNNGGPISDILKEYKEILSTQAEHLNKFEIVVSWEEIDGSMGPEGCQLPTEITVYKNRWTQEELIEKTIAHLRKEKFIKLVKYEECVVSDYCEGERDTKLKIIDLEKFLEKQFKRPKNIMGTNVILYKFNIPQFDVDDYSFDIKDYH